MAIVDRNVLRLAVNEFLFEETPHTVIINEALELTRAYAGESPRGFINGVIDNLARKLRPAEIKGNNKGRKPKPAVKTLSLKKNKAKQAEQLSTDNDVG